MRQVCVIKDNLRVTVIIHKFNYYQKVNSDFLNTQCMVHDSLVQTLYWDR